MRRMATTCSEHIDDVLVAEDDEQVVVFATVCTPLINGERHLMEGPHHVYVERPLGGRKVYDGVTGREVPYRNVYDELREEGYLSDWDRNEPIERLDPGPAGDYDGSPDDAV